MAHAGLRDAVRAHLRSTATEAADVEDFLQGAVEAVGELLGVDVSCTISTLLYGRPVTVATTDGDAWEADQIEFDVAEGPCVQLLGDDDRIAGIDLTTERRWPAWAAVAALLGFGSAAAVGASFDSGQRLVLNCYSVGVGLLAPDTVDRAQQYIDELADLMPVVLRLAEQSQQITQLQEALASRSAIDQALGVLMAQNRCTRDEAFAILRRASQNRNVKLREVAAAVIERITGHPVEAPPPFRPAARPQS